MSWMDSWARPAKSQATPPPFYLIPGSTTRYCKCCGRVIGARKEKSASTSTPPAYCSVRCRARKLGPVDRQIDATFLSLLTGSESLPSGSGENGIVKHGRGKKKKGEARILVMCDDVDRLVFGDRTDPEKVFGRKKNRARRGVKDGDEWKSVDMEDDFVPGWKSVAPTETVNTDNGQWMSSDELQEDDEYDDDDREGGARIFTKGDGVDGDILARLSIRNGTRIRPPQTVSEVNGGVGGEKGVKERVIETDEMLAKRREGQRKAEEMELVRCGARRAVVFGLTPDEADEKQERRLCEAVMKGEVVESSFAKGEWGIRWRE